MNVLFCASEAAPLVKMGGLGDVAGSLPKALKSLGVTVTVAAPFYNVIDRAKWLIKQVGQVTLGFAGTEHEVTLYMTTLPTSNVAVLLFENDTYLSQGGQNAFEGSVTEAERYAFFSKAIVEVVHAGIMPFDGAQDKRELFRPEGESREPLFGNYDLIHLNDWHTSFIPVLWKVKKASASHAKDPAFLLTIHNMSYQGVAGLELLKKVGIKETQDESLKWDAANNDVDLLLEGLTHADAINTVSPSYAKEIVTPEYGAGLSEILERRQDRLFGILNGIDYTIWNPETDMHIEKTYTLQSVKEGKSANKIALQKALRLGTEGIPTIGFIGRIEPKQKGIDLIFEWLSSVILNTFDRLSASSVKQSEALPAGRQESSKASVQPTGSFLPPAGGRQDDNQGLQFILLGTGDSDWESKLRSLVQGNESWLSINILFDEKLAHAMYAGCDYILMPSKFEPCGLPQMIAERYGTLPIVHAVGGLKDTVVDGWTGFTFNEYSAKAMVNKIDQAVAACSTSDYWKMSTQAMQQDYSWNSSAKKYKELYEKTVDFSRQ